MSIRFRCQGKPDIIAAASGQTILEAAALAGLAPDASCGGNGTCGKCKVWVEGALPPPDACELQALTARELASGCRLACRVVPDGDASVVVRMCAPARNGGAASRKTDLTGLHLPDGFMPAEEQATTVAYAPGADVHAAPGPAYGLAVDIGTTTVVGILCDLQTQQPVAAVARANPQRVFGADVISRIHYASLSSENLTTMHTSIIGCVNDILDAFAVSHGAAPETVHVLAVVGNTAMSHFFLCVDASSLARAPFQPVFQSAVTVNAAGLGLRVNPVATVYVLPNIAGHVGADITGVLLAAGLPGLHGASLVLDIGTNGEALLAMNGKIVACSTAAGPAFEGASIRHGMRADDGAIEGVAIKDGEVALAVIGGGVPAGICGSGLIDAIAQLLDAGAIDKTGRLLSREAAMEKGLPTSALAGRLVRDDRGNGFTLFDDAAGHRIVLTQKDIREVQLAKGALAAGVQILLRQLGLTADQLDRILIAGAFGSYIKTESALRIGLLPPVPVQKVRAIGNAAGTGACMALLSQRQRAVAEAEAARVLHIELATHPNFVDEHMKEMGF